MEFISPITGVNTLPTIGVNIEQKTENLINDMKSIDMLEMSNHFKSELDSKNKKIHTLTVKHNKLFKLVSACYGSVRMIDSFMENIEFEDGIFMVMRGNIEFLRTELSKTLHEYIPKEDSDSEDDIIEFNLD